LTLAIRVDKLRAQIVNVVIDGLVGWRYELRHSDCGDRARCRRCGLLSRCLACVRFRLGGLARWCRTWVRCRLGSLLGRCRSWSRFRRCFRFWLWLRCRLVHTEFAEFIGELFLIPEDLLDVLVQGFLRILCIRSDF